jgi:hypothetical protein
MDAESKERARDYLAADIFVTTFDWPEFTFADGVDDAPNGIKRAKMVVV